MPNVFRTSTEVIRLVSSGLVLSLYLCPTCVSVCHACAFVCVLLLFSVEITPELTDLCDNNDGYYYICNWREANLMTYHRT
jgi:hypothetical protein